MDNFFKRTWAEINLDAIRHNYMEIKKSLDPNTKICCVVKADGYGHGASFVAKELEDMGAEWFAVSNLELSLIHISTMCLQWNICLASMTNVQIPQRNVYSY